MIFSVKLTINSLLLARKHKIIECAHGLARRIGLEHEIKRMLAAHVFHSTEGNMHVFGLLLLRSRHMNPSDNLAFVRIVNTHCYIPVNACRRKINIKTLLLRGCHSVKIKILIPYDRTGCVIDNRRMVHPQIVRLVALFYFWPRSLHV